MMLKLKHLILVGAIMAQAAPVIAKDVALIIGNSRYDHQDNIRDASQVQDSIRALNRAGFTVLSGQNLDRDEQKLLATKFHNELGTADRVVILLRGHFVSTSIDTWLLATDARNTNAYFAGDAGLSVGALMAAAAEKPGLAVVMLGTQKTRIRLGDWIKAGPGDMNVPQGVALVQGSVGNLTTMIADLVSSPNQSLHGALRNSRNLVATGYLPKNQPFGAGSGGITDEPIINDNDRAFWEAVKTIGTVEAIQTYIVRYPSGKYYYEARDLIAELQSNPERQAKAAEDRLQLSRENRRQIQRNLSILGFDPRGVDGVFGPGSRAAIAAWQRSRGIEGYGYLTGNQITALQASADTRSRELEKEADRRRAELERQDVSYWGQTGRAGTERGLRDYLRRYPDGLYSELALDRLDEFDERRRDRVSREERDFWDRVRENGSIGAYRQYLRKYPRGSFADTAKARIDRLEEDARNAELIRKAKAEEGRVASSGIARLLIEQKLQKLGLKPGPVDGKFDTKTRRALRKFQRARELPVTGYVSQNTIVRLLSAR